jgi:N-acetylmuramoyl-L-alanine amidase
MYVRAAIALIVVLILGLITVPGQAASVSVHNLRMWRAPDNTRLVFDLSGPLNHNLFSLKNPDRIVIDIDSASLTKPLPPMKFDGPVVKNIRTGHRGTGDLRIVLDLKRVTAPRAFVLKPFQDHGYRLVIDLDHTPDPRNPAFDTDKPAANPDRQPPVTSSQPSSSRPVRRSEIVVAIDAGHGGEDPGAIGRRYRTREKQVVLNIARELKKLIDREHNMRAILTRKGDYFVPLAKRVHMAQDARADIFVSIHADSLPKKRARGASVYALSQRGATSRLAKRLADQENASDYIGGILENKDPIVQKVLVDLNQTSTIVDSLALGRDVLASLKPVGHIHSHNVEQAGFAVLKSPFMPSVLIETAFISNPAEEKRLRTHRFQRRMARGIFNGVKRYIKRKGLQPIPRAVPRRADKTGRPRHMHLVRRGETLSGIAQRYGVEVRAIRLANNLPGNKVKAGESLLIPRL